MAGRRKAIELAMSEEDLAALRAIARSRSEPASRVERARMLLAYWDEPSFFKVGRAVGAHHQTVQRCVERALVYGPMAALDDRPRPGKEPTITAEAKAWVVDLACRKAKELGYPHELWTTRLLARHAREHGPAEGHACLAKLAQGTLCKILNEQEIKPHKVRYYLERRDPEFKQKMAQVLCVYREVKLIKETAAAAKQEPSDAVAIVSYDEKPGIQAIATTAPDLPPEPGRHATFARDHEYKRHGTVSLLAGIDLLTGQTHALVKDRHRSREFIEFLKLLDASYPAHTAIKLILDNHSAHISKETKAWLAEQPAGRFEFIFTPKHGSWLNLVEGFFSKLARSVLRHIRVASKKELKDRIIAGFRHQVAHRDVDLALRRLRGVDVVGGSLGQERLGRRRVSALSDRLIHAVARDHFHCDLGRTLQVVGSAGRHLSVKDQRFRGASAHQHGDAVFQLLASQQKAILGRPLHRIAERADAARNDRHLVDRIDARQGRGDQRMAHLVMGDTAAFRRAEDAALPQETREGTPPASHGRGRWVRPRPLLKVFIRAFGAVFQRRRSQVTPNGIACRPFGFATGFIGEADRKLSDSCGVSLSRFG